MPARSTHDPSYLDEHHQRITEFANDYFDDDEERDAFVDTLMERRGYQRTHSWAPPPEQEPPGPNGQRQPQKKQPQYFKR